MCRTSGLYAAAATGSTTIMPLNYAQVEVKGSVVAVDLKCWRSISTLNNVVNVLYRQIC
jgi:hypothetical protein